MGRHFDRRTPDVLYALALVVCLPAAAVAQAPAAQAAPPVSVARVAKGLGQKPAAQRLKVNVPVPAATFRTSVEREYMLPFKEQLHKEFALTTLQRQSQEWASKGRGLNLLQLAKGAKAAYRNYQARKIHEEVAQELAQVEAAAKTPE
jgi:hypothetical protein